MLTDDKLAAQAKAATKDNFKIAFEDAFMGAVLGRKDRNDDILALILDKPDLAQALKSQMLDWIYHGLQERKSIPELLAAGESDTVEFKSSARWNLPRRQGEAQRSRMRSPRPSLPFSTPTEAPFSSG